MSGMMTIEQLAEYLSINRDVLRRKARQGVLPCYKIGGRFRFYKSEIDEWIQKQRYTPKEEVKEDETGNH